MTDAGFWLNARDVLCIRTDNMGDVLMSTPAMRAVAGEGARRVTLLTSQFGASVAPFIPELTDVVVYDAPWTPQRRDGRPAGDLAFVQMLRERRFDAAIVFTVCTQDPMPAAYLALLAEIPLRLAHEGSKGYGLLTDPVPDPETAGPLRHEVERQLSLVGSVGYTTSDTALSFSVRAADRAAVRQRLGRAGITGAFVAIHPGATAPSRRYEAQRFAEVGLELGRRGVAHVYVAASHDADSLVALRPLAETGTPVLVDLTLGEMGALFAEAGAVVANNSGPSHLSAAVGTPVVCLYARTNLQHAPWGVPARTMGHEVSCSPCLSSVCLVPGHPCLDVAPAEVADAAVAFLSAGVARQGSRQGAPQHAGVRITGVTS